jgi:hypothetical protein
VRVCHRVAVIIAVAAGIAAGDVSAIEAARSSSPDCLGDFRYRFEWVDEDGFDRNARASTLLSRLTCRAGLGERFDVLVEGSNVLALGSDHYNPVGDPDRSRFPVVADPEDTRLARFSLRWLIAEGVDLSAGRHRIKLDNDRFIGNVGWRQNEQTYDSIRLQVRRDRWTLFYAYVDRVHRVFDQDLPIGRHDHRSHLLNASAQVASGHTLLAYFYEIDNRDAPGLANATAGLRYSGSDEWNDLGVDWLAEFAYQQDTGRAPVDYSARYLHAEATATVRPAVSFRAGFERLEGDRRPGRAFRTPLATLHAFNGWADRFLTTPDGGLDDYYIGLLGQYGNAKWQLIGHEFRSEVGNDRFGREVDASVAFPLAWDIKVLLKAAYFLAAGDTPFRDATKLWVQLGWAWD